MADCSYCGLGESAGGGVVVGMGSEVVEGLCDVVGKDCACGASGPVVMALSGLSR
jgi:hypothetical protein